MIKEILRKTEAFRIINTILEHYNSLIILSWRCGMKHTQYVNKCSEVIKSLLCRQGDLREALIPAIENCFDHFPINDIPYGDGCKCEEIIALITDNGRESLTNGVKKLDENQVTDLVNKIFQLNIDLIVDETMEKVDNLWKTTYLRPMKFHN
jgi:hypothetical protein